MRGGSERIVYNIVLYIRTCHGWKFRVEEYKQTVSSTDDKSPHPRQCEKKRKY